MCHPWGNDQESVGACLGCMPRMHRNLANWDCANFGPANWDCGKEYRRLLQLRENHTPQTPVKKDHARVLKERLSDEALQDEM